MTQPVDPVGTHKNLNGENVDYSKIAQEVVKLLTPKITEVVDRAITHGLEQFHKDIQVYSQRLTLAEEWISELEDELQKASQISSQHSKLQKLMMDEVEDLENEETKSERTWRSIYAIFSSGIGCKLRASNLSGAMGHGDILIGALLPFHIDKLFKKFMFIEAPPPDICSMFLLEMFQHFQAMRFALEEINGSPDLLSNVTLGFVALDSCAALRKELEGTLWMLTGQAQPIPNYSCRERPHLAAVLGHTMSSSSILMAHILGVYRFPQISHFSTSSLLSDRTRFPSFFRTVPSDTFQSKGLAQLILHFAWKWVGLVAFGNDYGQQGVQVVKKEVLKAGACVAFTEFIVDNSEDRNIPHVTRVIKESTANAVLVFASDLFFVLLVEEMLKENVNGKIFVASEAWSTSPILGVEKYSSILVGSIGFAFYSSVIPGFKEFVTDIHPLPLKSPEKSLNQILWENIFGCRFFDQMSLTQSWNNSTKLCTGFENLSTVDNVYTDMSNLRGSFSIYTSVQVIAKALHDMSTCQKITLCSLNGSVGFFDKHSSQKIPKSICSESCSPGFRRVVRRGTPVCCFECVLCPYGEFSNRTDSDDCYKCPWNLWPNAERTKCLPKTIEYLSYEGTLGGSLTAAGVSSSLMTVFILCLFFRHRHTPIVKANNYSLSCILLMSISLCFLCSLNFIGYPQTLTCLMRQVIFGMVFAVCISTVLAKTIMVVFAFMATKPNSRLRRWTSPKVSYVMIFMCSVTQLLLCVLWLTRNPPYFAYNTQTQPEIIIAECSEGSPSAFWSMLGYLGLLSSVSFIVAFLARTLPDSFNEAKFITFSMLAFLSVWVSYIPATLSARGQYVVAMEVFAILSSSWALVICMFFPKCYIILFRPSMNSKEYLRGKDMQQNNN
ncbi:extracellular calcium-sensing receptor-like [Aquarana catesbeiana]|uniref:extracellular calcium-sensing receptor-like n=1 Tax=Aquarana catesbeiana TaxID=8400 RepID=UPI003CC9D6A6